MVVILRGKTLAAMSRVRIGPKMVPEADPAAAKSVATLPSPP